MRLLYRELCNCTVSSNNMHSAWATTVCAWLLPNAVTATRAKKATLLPFRALLGAALACFGWRTQGHCTCSWLQAFMSHIQCQLACT
eukprot:2589723-Amphidinium_carterae.2